MPLEPVSYGSINSLADFTPLAKLGDILAKQREEEEAARLIGGLTGQQPPSSGGFLTDLGRRFGLLPQQPAPTAATYQPAGPPRFSNTEDLMANYGGAISKIESGGKYDLLGPTTKSGDRAYGKYQVMGANIPEWTKAALGREMTPQEFLADPAAQDAVFNHRFGIYAQKYGPENAAKAWFAGERGMSNPNARDQLGTSVASYAAQFKRNLPPEIARGQSERIYGPNEVTPFETGQFPVPERIYNPDEVTPFETGQYPSALPPTDVSAQSRAAPAADNVVGRAVNNLVSPAPAAAAGIGRDQLAALYRNPLTRPLAAAFLQKQFDPGTWTYQQVGDRLIAANSKTGETKVVMTDTKPFTVGDSLITRDAQGNFIDVTPPSARKPVEVGEDKRVMVRDPNEPSGFRDVTPGGAVTSKIARENAARYADAKARGYDETTANYYAVNGKLPKEDLSATEMKAITDAQKQVTSGQDVLDNLARLKELSPTAWSGWGASKRAAFVNAVLPNAMIPQGAIDTGELSNVALQNVAAQAKAVFGARLAVAEVKLLNEIETTPEMSDPQRQAIYKRIEKIIKRHVDAASAEAEGIRNKTYFKPGGGERPTGALPDPLGLR